MTTKQRSAVLTTYLQKAATPTQTGQALTLGDLLPIASISTDEGTQARAGVDGNTVEAYAQDMLGGATFPPIIVYHSGSSYWLADGFHRVAAAKQIGRTELRAEVRMGDKRAAILCAVGANDTHGLRRTPADKRRAIMALLEDDEWRQWSDSAIATQVKVDHKTVARVRAELVATGAFPSSSIRQSADGKLRDVRGISESNARRKVAPADQALLPAMPTPAQPTDGPQMAEWWDVKARFSALGWELTTRGDLRYCLMPSAGGVGTDNMTWYAVVGRLEAQEKKASESAAKPTEDAIDRTPHGTPPDLFAANLSLLLEPNGWIIVLRGPGTTLTPNHYLSADAAIRFAREHLMPPEMGSEAARIINAPWPTPAGPAAAYEAAEASDRSLIAAAALAGRSPDPAQIQVAQWQAEQTNDVRRLSPGAHANALTLLISIRTDLITYQIGAAQTHIEQLRAIVRGETEIEV